MTKRAIISLVVVLVLGYTGYSLWRSHEKAKAPHGMPEVTVEATQAKTQQWYDQIEATGTLSAFQGVMVRPEVSGTITKIYFESGQKVAKGAPLIQIYPDILEAQLERDEAATALSEVEFRRAEELFKKKAISKQDLDQQSSQLLQNQAKVAQTKAQLRQHNIVAPFAGALGLKLVDVGDFVSVGQNLVNLQKLDPIRIEFSVPEVELSKLRMGQTVELYPSSEPNTIYEGEVYAFDSAVDIATRSLYMRAKVPNHENKLVPGTFAKVTLLAGEKHPVITVPQTAIVYSPEGNTVYKVIDGKATKFPVKLGMRRQTEIQIVSGVDAGDTVVTAGQIKLTDNSPVKVSPTDVQDQPQKPEQQS